MAACPTASGASACFWAGWCCSPAARPPAWSPPTCRCCSRGAYCRERERVAASCWRAPSPATFYGSDRVAQVIAYLTAAYVLGPMLAPPIGGQLTVLFGWRALFVFASAIGLVVILAVAFAVPETRARNVSVPRGVFAGYKSLLRRSRFVGFMLEPGLMSGAFFTQATAASFLAAEHLGADAAKIGLWFFAFPVGFMAGSFISGRIGANRSIEFMTILGGVIGVANGALLVGWLYFGGVSMAALYIPGIFVGLAQGLAMPYAQAGAMAVDTELAGSAAGAVVFSQFFWPAALQQLTGLLADGTWVPMATVHFAAMTAALLAGWMAVRARASAQT